MGHSFVPAVFQCWSWSTDSSKAGL
ncbi:unnamed protein product [Calypogeia fissa]